ncbi:galactose mutarotase [Drosophila rhopaloa]|uniref:Galactose mutarotase n=1 Tax=Drosophila rhopaloa TaxID=1041015 RepID=A0A6P4FDY9_DRORH|nr:galactose mutarotase [Drosophila rhopaloa]
MVKVVEDIFGIATNPFTKKAQVIRRYTMTNTNRLSVSIIQLGATIQSIQAPDAYHQLSDVVLGFDDIAGYNKFRNYKFGCTLGRVTDVVGNGEFIMDERRIIVSKNLGQKHQINGGFVGFDQVIWDLHMKRPDGITLRHVSQDGHEGFPGTLKVYIHFTIDDDNRFFIRIEGTTDQTTPVNISNHIYFNLAGQSTGIKGIFDHSITIEALETMDTSGGDGFPTGQFSDVNDSVYDIRLPVSMGDRVRQFEKRSVKGYNVCYALDKEFDSNITRYVGRFLHPESGRFMEIFSNQPSVKFATANDFPQEPLGEEPILGKKCTRYWQHCGFSLQLLNYPDAVNQPDFPRIFINPGEHYFHETIYHFGVQESWKCCADPEELEALGEEPVKKPLIK